MSAHAVPCREASPPVRNRLYQRCRAARTRTRRETRSSSPSTPSVAVASPRHQGSTSRASSALNHQSRRPSTHPERWCIPPPHGAAFTRTPAGRGTFAALRHAPSGAGLREPCRASRAAPAICGSVPPLCLRALTGAKGRGLQQRVGAGGRRLGLPGAAPLCTARLHERAGRGRATMYSPGVAGHPP